MWSSSSGCHALAPFRVQRTPIYCVRSTFALAYYILAISKIPFYRTTWYRYQLILQTQPRSPDFARLNFVISIYRNKYLCTNSLFYRGSYAALHSVPLRTVDNFLCAFHHLEDLVTRKTSNKFFSAPQRRRCVGFGWLSKVRVTVGCTLTRVGYEVRIRVRFIPTSFTPSTLSFYLHPLPSHLPFTFTLYTLSMEWVTYSTVVRSPILVVERRT